MWKIMIIFTIMSENKGESLLFDYILIILFQISCGGIKDTAIKTQGLGTNCKVHDKDLLMYIFV